MKTDENLCIMYFSNPTLKTLPFATRYDNPWLSSYNHLLPKRDWVSTTFYRAPSLRAEDIRAATAATPCPRTKRLHFGKARCHRTKNMAGPKGLKEFLQASDRIEETKDQGLSWEASSFRAWARAGHPWSARVREQGQVRRVRHVTARQVGIERWCVSRACMNWHEKVSSAKKSP